MATLSIDYPKENRILRALPSDEYGRLEGDLQFVHLERGQVLYDSGIQQGHVYFPTSCLVSLVFAAENGSSAELAIVGNDGLIGIPMILGGHSTTHRAVVQSAGNAFLLKSDLVRWELDQGGALLPLALRYTQALMTQIAQGVVCNRHHSVIQQLCRWLLFCLDRLTGNQLDMTQELIANMLGVRREAVTEAAGKLQAAGLIQYRRGHISVTDRAGVEARACECYSVVKQEQERLFTLAPEIHNRGLVRPEQVPLRERAEKRLQVSGLPAATVVGDSSKLLYELQVHQIEIEIQLEELQRSSVEATALRDRYADIYDFAPVGYVTLNGQGDITELNLAGAILLGIKRSEKSRHRFSNTLIPACQPEFNRFLSEVLKASNKKVCEVTLAPTPQRPEAIVKIEAVPDESGGECRMVLLDISAERQADKLLVEREHYLRTLIDNFPFMVWLKDDQSRLLAVNKAFSEESDWPSLQSIPDKVDQDISLADLAAAYGPADDSADLVSAASLSQNETVDADGTHRWIETYESPVLVDGQRVGTMGFSQDISERKAVESALVKSDELNRSALNSVPTEIAVIDSQGVILTVNDQWRLFAERNGFAPGLAAPNTDVGSNYLAICQAAMANFSPGALAANDGIKAVLDGLVPSFRMEYQCDSPEQHRWFSMTVTPLVQNANDGAVITHTDITERKLLEAQIRAQALLDPLTKLPNRILFKDRLRQAMASSKRSNRYGALLFIGLDNLEQVDDPYGHEVSDQLLIEVAVRLRRCNREMDTVARFDDGEFVVILSALGTDKELAISECIRVAEKLCQVLREPYSLRVEQADKTDKYVEQICTASIVISMFISQLASREDVLKWAELARYDAKMAGGNAVRFHKA